MDMRSKAPNSAPAKTTGPGVDLLLDAFPSTANLQQLFEAASIAVREERLWGKSAPSKVAEDSNLMVHKMLPRSVARGEVNGLRQMPSVSLQSVPTWTQKWLALERFNVRTASTRTANVVWNATTTWCAQALA